MRNTQTSEQELEEQFMLSQFNRELRETNFGQPRMRDEMQEELEEQFMLSQFNREFSERRDFQ